LGKKIISKNAYNFIKNELKDYKNKGIITIQQEKDILNLYEVGGGLNFIRVLVVVGSILIGLGILSFIASNWQIIGRTVKFLLIVVSFSGSYYLGYKLEMRYPRTARSFIYLSLLIYGAGIFLIGQMFNYGGDFTNAFLMWTLGILPMALIFKDKYIFLFAHILTFVYLNGHFRYYDIPITIIPLIGGYYYLNRYFDYSKIITFFTNAIVINFIFYLTNKYNMDGFYITAIIFIIGLMMYYFPMKLNRNIFKIQGSIIFGMAGLLLTIREVWNDLHFIKNADIPSIIFGIMYLVFLLFLTKKGNLISLIFICITIFRYYFDTMYNFMPKSLFFVIGGVILVGFGYYFERMRKEVGGVYHED